VCWMQRRKNNRLQIVKRPCRATLHKLVNRSRGWQEKGTAKLTAGLVLTR
jgi:hypothetical protein